MRRFPHREQAAERAGGASRDSLQEHQGRSTSEIARFKAIAMRGAFAERFMTAPSPGIISTTMLNAHYDIARSLPRRDRARDEQGISGDPQGRADPADRRARSRHGPHHDVSATSPTRDFVKRCELHVAAINKGIEGIPRDRVRLHVCYGNWEGPHIHDIAAGEDPAGALPGQCRRAVDRVLQSAPRARIRGVQDSIRCPRT